jgi:Pyridoxamine 5'-phosphate oxidase like
MQDWLRMASAALVSGTAASLAMTAALALLARREGKRAIQPINSTSHWLHGEDAGSVRKADLTHTAIGYGTHHASALLWAFIFEKWLSSQPPRTPLLMLRDASVMSGIAAAVDYGITPKRLTPGREEVLSKHSIALTYGAMALGLAAGAMLTQEHRRTHASLGTQESDTMTDVQRVWHLMEAVQFCMFSTWTGSSLRSRPMHAYLHREENLIRFLGDVRQHKDEEVREYPEVCLAFSDPRRRNYVSISGAAHVSNDREMIRSLSVVPSESLVG